MYSQNDSGGLQGDIHHGPRAGDACLFPCFYIGIAGLELHNSGVTVPNQTAKRIALKRK